MVPAVTGNLDNNDPQGLGLSKFSVTAEYPRAEVLHILLPLTGKQHLTPAWLRYHLVQQWCIAAAVSVVSRSGKMQTHASQK